MKQINKIARWVFCAIMTVMNLNASAQTSAESEIQEYFYPFANFSYIMSPDSENSNMVVTYKMSNGNVLTKKTEMMSGYSARKVAEDMHKLTLDEERQAVVSTQQIIQNMMGTRRASDKITMFVLPKDSKPVSWKETANGETSNCTAKFVYITFVADGKKLYRKAVKIEKTTPLDTSRSVKEWSYWVKGLSRLATYGYWGDPNKVSCTDKSVNINLDEPIKEITEAEYNRAIQ